MGNGLPTPGVHNANPARPHPQVQEPLEVCGAVFKTSDLENKHALPQKEEGWPTQKSLQEGRQEVLPD